MARHCMAWIGMGYGTVLYGKGWSTDGQTMVWGSTEGDGMVINKNICGGTSLVERVYTLNPFRQFLELLSYYPVPPVKKVFSYKENQKSSLFEKVKDFDQSLLNLSRIT